MNDWPDTGLYHRLRNAVELLARAKGPYGPRAYAAAQQITVLAPHDFPTAELFAHYRTIVEICAKAADRYDGALHFSGLWGISPKERDSLTSAVLGLFEAAARSRGANEAASGRD